MNFEVKNRETDEQMQQRYSLYSDMMLQALERFWSGVGVG